MTLTTRIAFHLVVRHDLARIRLPQAFFDLGDEHTTMQNPTGYRILRAMVLAGLAALTLSTNVFVAVDRIRVKVLQTSTPATAGLVRATTAGFPQVNELRPPFALIARINFRSAGTSPFSIAVDGAPVCERDVAGGGSRRVDCAVAGEWNPAIEHEVAIHGPPAVWTLDYLELATHHGNTDGVHSLLVLPASSGRYVRPALGWVIGTWLVLAAAILLLPAPRPLPRWIRLPYRVMVGAILLELALSQCSQWISNYRIVLSAGTFTIWLILLLAPRLWVVGRLLAQTGAAYVDVRTMAPWKAGLVVALVLCASGLTAWTLFLKSQWEQIQIGRRSQQARDYLFEELQPVKLANCQFERFGERNDGGYVLCANLLGSVQSGYSYGISGYDQWGCDVSRRLAIPVHQYDCFNLQEPACTGGRTVFHGECVGGEPATIDGRPFDTLENQFAKNGDGDKRLVVKMDVEGAEWDTLLRAPDDVLQRIDQLTIELHGVHEQKRFIPVVARLKQFFYIANLHFNNFSCEERIAPFPAWAYEVLFVSKRVGVPGGSGTAGASPSLMAPNNPQLMDCQAPRR
jgi:hypothetical protein